MSLLRLPVAPAFRSAWPVVNSTSPRVTTKPRSVGFALQLIDLPLQLRGLRSRARGGHLRGIRCAPRLFGRELLFGTVRPSLCDLSSGSIRLTRTGIETSALALLAERARSSSAKRVSACARAIVDFPVRHEDSVLRQLHIGLRCLGNAHCSVRLFDRNWRATSRALDQLAVASVCSGLPQSLPVGRGQWHRPRATRTPLQWRSASC